MVIKIDQYPPRYTHTTIVQITQGTPAVHSSNFAPGQDVEIAVRIVNRQVMEAFQLKDEFAIAASYTKDALLLPPGSDAVEGADEIARFWRAAMERGVVAISLHTVSVESWGEIAIEFGHYTLLVAGGKVDRGKYIVIWRRSQRVWKLYRSVWNTSIYPMDGTHALSSDGDRTFST